MAPRSLVWIFIMTSVVVAAPSLFGDEPKAPSGGSFEKLFNGKDLKGWYTFLQKHGKDKDPDRVITIEDGAIHLYKDAEEGSNVVMGYISTEKEYGNYHFRVKYRWGKKKFQPRYALKRDAGLYYHILGEDLIWPRALQFQVQQTDVGDLIALLGLQADSWIDPKTKGEQLGPIYREADKGGEPFVLGGAGIAYLRRLPGEFEKDGWNTAEIIVKGDTTTHILNGQVVNRGLNVRLVDPAKPGKPEPVLKGRIALEIEAAEIFFKDVEIRSLDEIPSGAAKP
ncbi:3-keto-disaccharide hydrolase [Singulisphaera sp. PoT]|uniref:3-keto-disaccharide hydrolase n=1 Tax=Singulisphaera sp. PoT TaxID=3411797 RepID=UPI003BF48385